MLEKVIKNGLARDTGNIMKVIHNKKTNKLKILK